MSKQITTPAAVRANNLSLTLNLIHTRGVVARTELIEHTNLSGTTISALVNVLIDSGFVIESGEGVSSGGRRPMLLEFNYNARHVIGVDMGARHITVVLMNLKDQILASAWQALDVIHQPALTLDTMREMVSKVITQAGVNQASILGVGLTLPTPVSADRSGTFMTYYMPDWEGMRPAVELSRRIHLPVVYENDANAAALAEMWWGSGRGCRSLAYIKLGTGVGSGLVINGEIYRGSSGSAGEVGHTTIEADGRVCRCGNPGCMESYVGVNGFLEDARAGLRGDPAWAERLDELTVDEVIHAAQAGNPVCQTVLQNAGRYLGIGIANLFNLFNPELVILGGDLVNAGPLLMEPVQQSVRQRSIPIVSQSARIIVGELGANAVAVGGAALVVQHAFDSANLYQTLHQKGLSTSFKEVMHIAR